MVEYDVRLGAVPESTEQVFSVNEEDVTFDAAEIALLRQGKELRCEMDGGVYYITAPIKWAAVFSSQVQELAKAVITADSPEAAQAQAEDLRALHVSAEYRHRHKIYVMPAASVPKWYGQTRDAGRPNKGGCQFGYSPYGYSDDDDVVIPFF